MNVNAASMTDISEENIPLAQDIVTYRNFMFVLFSPSAKRYILHIKGHFHVTMEAIK
jgi:hypothetical protein